MAQSFHVTSPRGVCAATGEPIGVGDPCVSLLIERANADLLERLDVARPAWDSGARPPAETLAGGAVVATWRTRMPGKDAAPRQLVDDDEVLDLFEQLADADDPKHLAFRYLLALILIRKKVLVWEGARQPEGDEPGVVLVRPRKAKDQPPMEVIDPGLDDEAIEAATRQLSAVMNLEDTPG